MIHGTRRKVYDDEQFDMRQVTDQLVADKVCSLVQDEIPKYSQGALGVILIYTILK